MKTIDSGRIQLEICGDVDDLPVCARERDINNGRKNTAFRMEESDANAGQNRVQG